MKAWANQNLLFAALGIYLLLWLSLYNGLGFMMDSDAVAYLTIAHRVADGDWLKSINGLWSPLNSWLLVPFIKKGYDSWVVAKVLNCFFGGVLLMQAWYFFGALKFDSLYKNILTLTLVPIICFYVYFQIFGDVLQLIFAMGYVQLFIKKDFFQNSKWVVFSAVIMGIGFYAKAYSLIFFLVHFSVLGFLAYRKKGLAKKSIIVNYILGVCTIILIVLPWAFQLQKKYGEFALTGMAGKLNMSWYINSGKTFNDSIQLLIPPAYEDSPSFWEDPYLSAGKLSTPFSSGHHFGRWVLRVGHTCLIAVKSSFEISFFFVPIVFFLLYKLYKRKKIPDPYWSIFLALLILPLGYLAMHIETRYIWLSTFLLMALGVGLVNDFQWAPVKKRVMLILFMSSLLLFPLFQLLSFGGKNKVLFNLADELSAKNISGKIVTNLNDEGSFWVVSYLAKLNNYTIEQNIFDNDLLLQEMKRYDIKYYLYFPREVGRVDDLNFLERNFEKIYSSTISSNILYKLKD